MRTGEANIAKSFSTSSIDEMAFRIMKMPGFTVVIAGEVFIWLNASRLNAGYGRQMTATMNLLVTYQNQSYFLAL